MSILIHFIFLILDIRSSPEHCPSLAINDYSPSLKTNTSITSRDLFHVMSSFRLIILNQQLTRFCSKLSLTPDASFYYLMGGILATTTKITIRLTKNSPQSYSSCCCVMHFKASFLRLIYCVNAVWRVQLLSHSWNIRRDAMPPLDVWKFFDSPPRIGWFSKFWWYRRLILHSKQRNRDTILSIYRIT